MQKITQMQCSLNVATIYIHFGEKLRKNNFLGKIVNTGLQLVFIINEDLKLRGLISLYFYFINTCHAE